MTQYNKLVRDRIIEIIEAKGGKAKWHVAVDEEYESKLLEKAVEEATELMKDPSIGEVADVLEVIEAICELKGFSEADVQTAKAKKAAERGGFKKRIILEES